MIKIHFKELLNFIETLKTHFFKLLKFSLIDFTSRHSEKAFNELSKRVFQKLIHFYLEFKF